MGGGPTRELSDLAGQSGAIGGSLIVAVELIDQMAERMKELRDGDGMRWTSLVTTRKTHAHLFARYTEDAIATLLVIDEMVAGNEVHALVRIEGAHPAALGSDLRKVLDFPDGSDLRDHLAHNMPGLDGLGPTAWLPFWSALRVPAMLVAVHKGKAGAVAEKAAQTVVPFLAEGLLVPVVVFDDSERVHLNAVLAEAGNGPAALPHSGLAVVSRSTTEPVRVPFAGKFSDKQMTRRASAVVKRVLAETAAQISDMTFVSTGLMSAPLPLAAQDQVLESVVSERDAEIERLQGLLEQRERDLRDLRRETAALAREVADATPEPAVATDPDTTQPEPVPGQQERAPPPPAPEPPPAGATLTEVLTHARAVLRLVSVPSYVDGQAAALLNNFKAARWAERTWEALVSLEQYAQARKAGSPVFNLKDYLAAVDHPLVSVNQVRLHESESVRRRPRFRRERTFPVPTTVDEAGEAFFEPHIRIEARGRNLAPRMYFFDDLSGRSGQIHLGYLGPHLSNTLTN